MSVTTLDPPRPARTATGPPGRPRRRPVLRRLPVWIAIAVILVVEIYPIFWLLTSSFKTQTEFLGEPAWSLPSSFGWDNYVEALTTGQIGQNLLNTVIVTVPSLLVILLLGSAAGYALEVMVWKGRHLTLLVFVGGIMVPGQMIIVPLFVAYFRLGLTETYAPLIITYIALGLPLTVFMMAAYLRAVPRELFEAAAIDGAGMLRSFFSIGLPLMKNAIFTIALIEFFSIWNDLLVALTFTTNPELATIQVGLLNFRGEFGSIEYGPLFAGICVNVFGTLLIYLFLNQRIMRGLAGGALKG